MTPTYILIAYLSYFSRTGGPITAEFKSQAACVYALGILQTQEERYFDWGYCFQSDTAHVEDAPHK